ncbi:MAG: hypothetical protein FWH21_01060 [Kiritimatiellaeota bacterium]|nr:hypothetical protein [Kiritimatiellota bacterium]
MTYLQLAAHLFLLLFWARFWVKPKQAFYFNPFLSGTTRFIDGLIQFLRPALRFPECLMPLVLLLLFWVFQTIFFARFGDVWNMSFGGFYFSPPDESLSWGMQFAYSGLLSAQLLLGAWTLYVLTRLIARPNRTTRAQEAFAFFMAPFSWLPCLLQLLVVLMLHFGLVYAVIHIGAVPHIGQEERFTGGPLSDQFLKTGALALLSFSNGLDILLYALFFFWAGAFSSWLLGNTFLMMICQENIEVLVGRFKRNPSTITGGLDFSLLIFSIVVYHLANFVQSRLGNVILAPPL